MKRSLLSSASLLCLGALFCALPVQVQAETAPKKPAATPAQPAIAFVHAEIHVGDGTVISDGTLLVRGNEIVAVGGPETAVPSDSETIDATGKWLTPGFIAMDTSFGLQEVGAERTTNDDSATTPGHFHGAFDPSTAIDFDSSTFAVAAHEGITSAVISPRGGLIAGKMSFVDLLTGKPDQALVAREIGERANLGQVERLSRSESQAMLRRALDDARDYRKNRAAYQRGQTRDYIADAVDLAALFDVLDRKIPLVLEAERASEIRGALAIARDYQLDLVLVDASEGWIVAEEIARANVPVLITSSNNLPLSFGSLNARSDNAALLAQAGVTVLLAGVDSPHHARLIKQEAGMAVSYGLAHETALTALTLAIAKAFHLDKRYGSLAKGKVANVVMWSGDPFEFSSAAQKVLIQGKPFTGSGKSRQSLLRDRYLNLAPYAR